MKKIVYFSLSELPSKSANSVNVMNMCEALSELGYEVTLIGREGHHASESDVYAYYGVRPIFRIRFLKRKSLLSFINASTLQAPFLILQEKPNLVISRSIIGCLWAVVQRINCVLDLHGIIENWKHKLVFQVILKSRWLIRITTNSNALKEIMASTYKIDRTRIVVAHNGSSIPPKINDAIQWDGREGILQVGYFGGIYPGRGVEIVLQLAQTLDDVDFHIFGGQRQDLHKLGLTRLHRNIFYHQHVAPGKAFIYREKCDILIAPYQRKVAVYGGKGDTSSYMCPIKLIEYKASNKAIVVSDLPVLHEIMPADTAVFVVPDDLNDWVGAINKLRNAQLRAQLGNTAYYDFCQRHTWEKRALKMMGMSIIQ